MSETLILSGKDVADSIYNNLNRRISKLIDIGVRPGLCVILIGDDPASQIYVRTKTKKLNSLGLLSDTVLLKNNINEKKVIKVISELNTDPRYHGILVQLPLPEHINSQNIINSIKPEKDVDGFHPENVGWLSIGKPRFIPCTPKGIMKILEHYNIDLNRKSVVVIGRSNIVGRPISILTSLNREWANATCTVCHSRTKNLDFYTKNADVVISAIGIPNFLKGDMLKKGSIVIDVGINRVNVDNHKGYKIVGDADWDAIYEKVASATPVPGGVGPMTIAMLVENTIEAAEKFG